MIFESYTQNDDYCEFLAADGTKLLMPTACVILVDDESGCIAIKSPTSRKTIGLVKKP